MTLRIGFFADGLAGEQDRAAESPGRRLPDSARSGWLASQGLLRLWAARRRERAALRDLDDHMLRDIGVTRHEAEREARLPFWRP